MLLLSPVWLIGLLPWVAAAAYLLRGYRPVRRVPFLAIWPKEASASPRSRRQLPRLSVVLLLLAALLAVVALARPAIRAPRHPAPPALLVDRGMSALPAERYRRLVIAVCAALEPCDPSVPMTVRFLPGTDVSCTVATLRETLLSRPPEPVDVSAELPLALAQLRAAEVPVLLVSGTQLPRGIPEGWLLVLRDSEPLRNAGIESGSFVLSPSPQLMLRLYNNSSAWASEVEIKGWEGSRIDVTPTLSLTRTVELPHEGEVAPRFVELSPDLRQGRAPAILSVRLTSRDDVAADDELWLVRQRAPIQPAQRGLPPELSKLLRAYLVVRQGGETAGTGARKVNVTTGDLRPEESGISVPAAMAGGETISLRSAVQTPLESLGGLPLPPDAQVVGGGLPGGGWQTLVSAGGQTVVACRNSPQRQVWVGFWSKEWAQTGDFAVFYSMLLDWIAGGEVTYGSGVLRDIHRSLKPLSAESAPSLWAGVFESSDGPVALNSPMPPSARSPLAAAAGVLVNPASLPEQMQVMLVRMRSRELDSLLWLLSGALAVAALLVHGLRPRANKPAAVTAGAA